MCCDCDGGDGGGSSSSALLQAPWRLGRHGAQAAHPLRLSALAQPTTLACLPPADNARNGLPVGLTIQPGGPGASQSTHTSTSASSDRLLSTLRGAAAAAAAEQAAEAAAERRGAGWLGRLLPGGWGGSGRAGTPLRRSVEAQAARGRLTRLLVPDSRDGDHGIGAADAGYTALPAGPPSAAAAAPAAGFGGISSSRPLRAAPGQHAHTASGGAAGDVLSSSLGSPSPTGTRGGGALKAFRARMLAGAGAGGGGRPGAGPGNAGNPGLSGSSQQGAGE